MSSKTIELHRLSTLLLGLFWLGLGGCMANGPSDNPFARSAQWRSYVAATDLRWACAPGSPETLRFVYNGDYKEETRSYDIRREGAGAIMEARRRGSTNLLDMDLLDPLGLWRGQKREVSLDLAAHEQIKAALTASGFRDAPEDARLRSDSFYWVVSACLGGEFRTNVWAWPSDRYERIRFAQALTSRDGFDSALKDPRPPFERFADSRREDPPFEIRFRSGQIQ